MKQLILKPEKGFQLDCFSFIFDGFVFYSFVSLVIGGLAPLVIFSSF